VAVDCTDDKHVALYDTVTGWAFGPTFDSADDAEHFRQYAEQAADCDVRLLTDGYLGELYDAWVLAERANGRDI
jgi:hypothetical protein